MYSSSVRDREISKNFLAGKMNWTATSEGEKCVLFHTLHRYKYTTQVLAVCTHNGAQFEKQQVSFMYL